MNKLRRNKIEEIEEIIKKTFKVGYSGKNIELIGISSENDNECESNKTVFEGKKLRFTAILKQGRLLFTVPIEEHNSREEILSNFEKRIMEHDLEL